jgi:hypothetical protein
MSLREEKQLLETVLERTALAARIVVDTEGTPSALVEDESHVVTIDAPDGWLRFATTIVQPGMDVVTRANLGLVHLQTGLGHVHYDQAKGLVRIGASLAAVTDAPSGPAALGTLEHLRAIRRKILTGDGEILADATGTETSDVPTLADVARVMGNALSLVADKDSFVGGLREPKSGVECALRLHTAMPGIFAADAWLLPPKRIEPDVALFERLDAFNGSLPAGVLFLVPGQGMILYRWACPYAWLALDQLEAPALAYTALAAFMRWITPS